MSKDRPRLGTRGRTLTDVEGQGRVEIEGVSYEAKTTSSSVPAGEEIAVTGWTIDEQNGIVLFIRRIGDDSHVVLPAAPTGQVSELESASEPLSPAQAAQDNRLRRIEIQLREQREKIEKTRGCLFAVVGFLVGIVLGFFPCGLILGFVSVRGPQGDHVTVYVLRAKVFEKSGPPGTATSVRTIVSVLFCAMTGTAGAVIGGRMAESGDG